MKIKKENIKLGIVVILLLSCLGCLYYYFFIRTDTNLMFWKKGESIAWDDIEYDDDFYPTDSTEVYGEFGEWKFKEFKPIYAGYGTTDDGLDYLIGKYLDEDGKEQTVNVLVSGEGMVEYPYPDKEYASFFDDYFGGYVAVRGEEWDPEIIQDVSDIEYSNDTIFVPIRKQDAYACPEELVFSYSEIEDMVTNATVDDIPYLFVDESLIDEYCNYYSMYYNADPWWDIVYTFDSVSEGLEIGEQISVKYLETEKSFEDCEYEYDGVEKMFCANQFLNETYDDFLVGIYLEN